MMDAKARLVRIIEAFPPDASPEAIADALLAAGVTLPEPPGPVTMKRWLPESSAGLFLWNAENVARELPGYTLGQEIRITIEDAATPSTLIPLAEVERRAREWWRRGGGGFSGLVTALTAPAATGEASTASSPPVCASCGERKEKCNGC